MGSGYLMEKFSYNLPSVINPSARYVFFLHGKIVEKHGPNGRHPCFGIYDYHGIVRSFRERGFVVISEIRPEGTKLDKYAGKIERQIRTLLTYGLSPEQITVVGFSKGSAIALLVSTRLKDVGINVVLMSGCTHNGTHVLDKYRKLIDQSVQSMQGHFLHIYDVSDQKCDVCRGILKNVSAKVSFNELMLKNGLGHGLFYQPRKEWIEPVADWIIQEH
ncbi:MAG: alpha/beta hydrolase [Desulfobacterales bacterium]